MATQDLGFNVFALDKASRTFVRLADRIEKVSDRLDELDRQRANPEINLDVDEQKARDAVTAFADAADDEGRRRKGGFFAAMFRPNRSILMALRTGIPAALSSPIGAAALTLGALFAGSFVAAVLTSGVFAAVGGGFTAIAAVVLRENQRLKASFADLAQTVQTDLMQVVQPLVPVFDTALSQVQAMFGPHIREPLEAIFEGLAPTIVPFAESAVRTVGAVLDSLATPEFLTGMQTVLDAITRELPRLGEAIGGLFTDLAGNADDIAEAFGTVVTATGGLIDFAAGALNAFTDLFNALGLVGSIVGGVLTPIITGLQRIDEELKEIAGPEMQDNTRLLENWVEGAKGGLDPALALATAITQLGLETEGSSGAMTKFDAEIMGLNRRAEMAAEEGLAQMQARQEQLTEAIDGTNDLLSHEQQKLDELKNTMFASAEGVLDLREAEVAYQEQKDATTETLARNGETLDINTEKGQENRRALDDWAETALQQIEAMVRQGVETDKVSKFTQQARDDFIKAARAAGLEKDEAKALADQLGLVPSEVETKIKAIDEMSDTINSLKRQIRELQRLAGIVPINATIGSFFGSAHVRPQDFHTGGIIGEPPRAHSGLRLGSDERVIIGQTGERILSREQNRAFEAQGGVDGLRHGHDGGITVNGPLIGEFKSLSPTPSLREIEQRMAMSGAA